MVYNFLPRKLGAGVDSNLFSAEVTNEFHALGNLREGK